MISARKLATIAILFEAAGIALLAFVLISLTTQESVQARSVLITSNSKDMATPVYNAETVHGKPVHVSVPSVGVDISIEDGFYDSATGLWSIHDYAAFFATISDQANNSGGSTFVYGHNSSEIFGDLRKIKPGATAVITTGNGYQFTYKLTGYEQVAPDEAEKLVYNGKTPRLVLQTCSGFWNETRQLTYFELVSYKKK